MIGLKLICQGYWQHIGSSDRRLVFLTQALLSFFLLTLTLSSASIQHYLNDNLENMLGSDLVLEQYSRLSSDQKAELEAAAERISETQLLHITLTHGERWQRAQLKIVDQEYPIQGQLSIGDSLSASHRQVGHGPGRDEMWVDSRLFTRLGLAEGETLHVAGSSYRVTAILFHEPDRIMEGHSVAMRAMVHRDSGLGHIVRTGAQTIASKIQYRYLISAAPTQQPHIEAWMAENLPGAKLISRHDGNHPLGAFWKRVENFIGLASILLFLMAAIALDLANRRQLKDQQYRMAVYMSMGMGLTRGLFQACGTWFLGFIIALLPAIGLAYVAQILLVAKLNALFVGVEFGWHLIPVLKTLMLLLALLFLFQLPTLIQLGRTSIVSLIREQPQPRYLLGRLVFNILGLSMLAVIYSDNYLLTFMVMSALVASLVLMMFVTYTTLTLGEKLSRGYSGLLPFMFFMMKQRLLAKSTQILGVGLCVTLLLFTLMLMRDIGHSLEQQQRTQDGNLIITEAQSRQVPSLQNWAESTGSQVRQLRPYVHAQLLSVNGVPLVEHAARPSESLARLARPVRLSWSDDVPGNNRLRDGHWWQAEDSNVYQVSVESEVMTDTGLELGDSLEFQVAGQSFSLTIVATHDFKPGAGSITFWFQAPPALIDSIDADTYFMGSMELPDTAWSGLVELWQRFPTLTMLPLKEITERFDRTLSLMTQLVLGFSATIIAMALIVIVASARGYELDDQKRNGLLLAMGLGQFDVVRLSVYEWLVTALIAGCGAVMGTWVAGTLIYQSQFSMSYSPSVTWVGTALALTTFTICAFGIFYCRKSLEASINQLLAS